MTTTHDTAAVTTTHPSPAEAAARARASFEAGSTRSLDDRRRLLRALRDLVDDHAAEFERALASDLDKSPLEARTTEIDIVSGEIALALRGLRAWTRPRRLPVASLLQPASARLVPEPLGTVLIIAPWNYPMQLLLSPLVGALAAGNTAVLKPGPEAPALADLVARLVPQHFPGGEVQVVTGDVDVATRLLDQRWDHIVFTGSGRVGRIVMAAAAAHLTPVTLELGGKSPVWFDDDAHLAEAARRIAWAKFTNAGQTCVAPDYVMTTPDRVPALAGALASAIADLYGPDPADSPDYGRIVTRRHAERLAALLDGDGRVVAGGEHDTDGRYVAPTVVVLDESPGGTPVIGPDSPHALLREEIFGPILPIVPTASPEAAVRAINSWDKPLALYVFSGSAATRRLFEERTSSGSVVHDAALIQAGASTIPFGGVGASGMGAYHGEASVRALSHDKPVLRKPLRPDTLRMVQPGASRRALDLVRRLQRRG